MSATTDKRPRIAMVVVKPPEGSRQKISHLVLVKWPYRSKWSTARCSGQAKGCKAGTCKHAAAVADMAGPRCRAVAWEAA